LARLAGLVPHPDPHEIETADATSPSTGITDVFRWTGDQIGIWSMSPGMVRVYPAGGCSGQSRMQHASLMGKPLILPKAPGRGQIAAEGERGCASGYA